MEHHIPLLVVGMEMVHMGQGNDMVLGLGDGKQVLGDMGQGQGDMVQHGVGGVRVDGRARAHGILDEVDGILAFLEVDLAWRIRAHCGIQQHQCDRMFLCIH